MRVKPVVIGVLAVVLSVALIGFGAGCGGDDDEDTTAATTSTTEAAGGGGGGATTQVGMTEYSFEPNDLTVNAGDTISLSNDGKIPHNFTIVEGDNPTANSAELAASDDIAPGDSGELVVDVEPGEYSFLCTISGHAEQGMTGTITVK
ncbi:MAG TPA: plastocyanin/azurin family copper-binding protein [Solirubrobacterales bacterium]|nr:plastocyanin/azurin family copper-binding protein [Solirubrobacterales bacterium]